MSYSYLKNISLIKKRIKFLDENLKIKKKIKKKIEIKNLIKKIIRILIFRTSNLILKKKYLRNFFIKFINSFHLDYFMNKHITRRRNSFYVNKKYIKYNPSLYDKLISMKKFINK